MKTLIIILVSAIIGFGAAYLLIAPSNTDSSAHHDSKEQLYTCGMHPEIISEEPGYCPICGMKLTPKKDAGSSMEGGIMIDPTTTHNIGIKTAEATRRQLTKSIRAFGKVEYAEPSIHTVNIKIPGWVEKLYVDYEGASVEAGEPLIEVYSPELVAAQREYLVAVKSNEKLSSKSEKLTSASQKLLEASEMRLRNWDITDAQIEELSSSGKLTKNMIIKSPASGIVVSKMINKGEYLKAGSAAYEMAALSTVWIEAFVYEQDLPFIELGQKALVEIPSLPGEHLEANISYISPFLDNNQQVEIRLDVHNHQMRLKPEMYAEVYIQSQLEGERLAIPQKAVINSGKRNLVFISFEDGSYSPQIIQTGAVADNDLIEITQGISEGDRIVVSGQFLLDSESRLSESLGMGGHQHGSSEKDGDSGVETHSQESSETTSAKEENIGIYTCPMPEHYHVLQYGSGKCPECNMKLVPVEKTDNEGFFHCPMQECQVVDTDPGRCPECGMHLIKYERGK
ncbi:MAG: efflux RND transporter periplasmic adaptor subunit [candidate division Zixibacteria bacterium]|nr:efflux RND transporter periplasmic adaptor subunit [candidate division Zixibacteria bacterium]